MLFIVANSGSCKAVRASNSPFSPTFSTTTRQNAGHWLDEDEIGGTPESHRQSTSDTSFGDGESTKLLEKPVSYPHLVVHTRVTTRQLHRQGVVSSMMSQHEKKRYFVDVKKNISTLEYETLDDPWGFSSNSEE